VSNALVDFGITLRQAQELISRERRFRDPPLPRSQMAVLGLRGGATVLMVATFERFLRDMAAENLERLAQRPPAVAFDDLPDKLRLSSVWLSLDAAMKGRLVDPAKGRLARLARVRRAAALIVDGVIDPIALSETGGNPDADAVRQLFSNAGVSNIFERIRETFEQAWGRPESQEFAAAKLDEIVNSRHRVAHRADALSISRSQLAEWPHFLLVLAPLLDSELEAHVERVLDSAVEQ
jgi:hypothetical protein